MSAAVSVALKAEVSALSHKRVDEVIGVVGLGYVGLPVAAALGRTYAKVVGFDINEKRIASLKAFHDHTGEMEESDLRQSEVHYTTDLKSLKGVTFFIATVPTPIDHQKRPDLTPVRKAAESIGKVIEKGAVVVFESTVYPGVTEDICAPIIEKESGLKAGVDFFMGYSPERINPGDKQNRLETILKIVSAQTPEALERVKRVYSSVVRAGLHEAPSIKVAEAAKVIENIQRDINIAFMNELALIFDRLGISTRDVLAAAGTKWNFLKFTPGLVGGHCIGVDPYYLTTKAQEIGYEPQVILAGRKINDDMGRFVAQKTIKLLARNHHQISRARIGVLGITFKENVPDVRNSKVPDIVKELQEYGAEVLVHDAMAEGEEVFLEYGIVPAKIEEFKNLSAVIIAVPHKAYLDMAQKIPAMVCRNGVLVDVKCALSGDNLPSDLTYWSL